MKLQLNGVLSCFDHFCCLLLFLKNRVCAVLANMQPYHCLHQYHARNTWVMQGCNPCNATIIVVAACNIRAKCLKPTVHTPQEASQRSLPSPVVTCYTSCNFQFILCFVGAAYLSSWIGILNSEGKWSSPSRHLCKRACHAHCAWQACWGPSVVTACCLLQTSGNPSWFRSGAF